MLHFLEGPQDAWNIVQFLVGTDADKVRLDLFSLTIMPFVQFYDIGNDGLRNVVFLENSGQESREDNIGIGASEVMAYQFRMSVEEGFATTAMIGQYQAFLQTSANSDADDGRKKTPTGAAVDMQQVVVSRHRTESHGKQ